MHAGDDVDPCAGAARRTIDGPAIDRLWSSALMLQGCLRNGAIPKPSVSLGWRHPRRRLIVGYGGDDLTPRGLSRRRSISFVGASGADAPP